MNILIAGQEFIWKNLLTTLSRLGISILFVFNVCSASFFLFHVGYSEMWWQSYSNRNNPRRSKCAANVAKFCTTGPSNAHKGNGRFYTDYCSRISMKNLNAFPWALMCLVAKQCWGRCCLMYMIGSYPVNFLTMSSHLRTWLRCPT